MDVLVDMVDPSQRDQMMLATGLRVAFCELDVTGAFQVIHGSDVLAVGAQDFHVFIDFGFVEHCYASIPYPTSTNTSEHSSGIPQFIDRAGTARRHCRRS
jgi:hypothetical protein